MDPRAPYRLVTVNTFPDRAKLVIGRMVKSLEDRYSIEHVANCERVEDVGEKVTELKPDLLFCASMWTSDEAGRIQSIARSIKPDIKTLALPQGLQAERGVDGVVEHLLEMVPRLLETS